MIPLKSSEFFTVVYPADVCMAEVDNDYPEIIGKGIANFLINRYPEAILKYLFIYLDFNAVISRAKAPAQDVVYSHNLLPLFLPCEVG